MTGHQLRVERVQKNLKQIELAQRTGIPRERLSRFENGWQRLHPEEIRRIRDVLDTFPERIPSTPASPTPTMNPDSTEPPRLQALSPSEDER
jgi:transcriptional regulator with XRE-family HTH domain